MANVKVLNMQGAAVGEIELQDEVFGAEVNVSAMHTVVRAYLNAQRQGTQSAKTRTEVRAAARSTARRAPATRVIMAAGLRSLPTAALYSLPSRAIIASAFRARFAVWQCAAR